MPVPGQPPKCKACGGSGSNSRGGRCWPCGGSGVSAAEVPKQDKVAHVQRARQTRQHSCHWPGCRKQVPPAMWGCREHWFRLPKRLRDLIWAAYRPGQETSMTPSSDYLAAAEQVQEWIRENAQ